MNFWLWSLREVFVKERQSTMILCPPCELPFLQEHVSWKRCCQDERPLIGKLQLKVASLLPNLFMHDRTEMRSTEESLTEVFNSDTFLSKRQVSCEQNLRGKVLSSKVLYERQSFFAELFRSFISRQSFFRLSHSFPNMITAFYLFPHSSFCITQFHASYWVLQEEEDKK